MQAHRPSYAAARRAYRRHEHAAIGFCVELSGHDVALPGDESTSQRAASRRPARTGSRDPAFDGGRLLRHRPVVVHRQSGRRNRRGDLALPGHARGGSAGVAAGLARALGAATDAAASRRRGVVGPLVVTTVAAAGKKGPVSSPSCKSREA